jgi:hypothetical protein
LKVTLAVLAMPLVLLADTAVVPGSYKIIEDQGSSYIYSDEYEQMLPQIREYQHKIIKQYEKDFGFCFDDRLRVGLASDNNQIANAFSTQMPFNSQILYGAGAQYIDYFCGTSWLKVLLIHETAHNFQMNPKESSASRASHKVLGNTPVSVLWIYPFFPVPNVMINSFILEGNAVMNESRFYNGGRLYSGYALAEAVTQAKAGLITPARMYNTTLDFPYGENYYLVGGFFQSFLAEKYGVDKVNKYFKLYSRQLFPFFVENTFRQLYGETFSDLLEEFSEKMVTDHADFQSTSGKVIATSQVFVPLNALDSEIYTVTSDLLSYPKILSFNKTNGEVSYKRGAYVVGEPLKIGDEYYTTGSVMISPIKIKMGLIDKRGKLKAGSAGKFVQGFMKNGKEVYIDIADSADVAHIYIDGENYDRSDSSVYVDGNDLFYFRQHNHVRTLYKNKQPLFSYNGYYGFPTDIDKEGTVYFVSLSKNGSAAYRFKNGVIERVIKGDDVIDFKIINDKEAFVVDIGSAGYTYSVVDIIPEIAKIPAPDYFLEEDDTTLTDADPFIKAKENNLPSKKYYPLTNLEYSSLDQSIGYSSDDGFIADLNANFSDPLMQNTFNMILSVKKQRTIGGLGYSSSAHYPEYGGIIYGVAHNDDYDHADESDYGYFAYVTLPLIASGYWRASSTLKSTKDYENLDRNPLDLTLDISNVKHFGLRKYPNNANALDVFASQDRNNNSFGASFYGMYAIPWQSFISISGSYMTSDSADSSKEKGIEISDDLDSVESGSAYISMPTLDDTLYAEELSTAEVGLYKTIDASLYFFTFPVSLQRETVYVKYRYYDLDLGTDSELYSETTLGVETDFVILNNIVLPLKIEAIYNPDSEHETVFRAMINATF